MPRAVVEIQEVTKSFKGSAAPALSKIAGSIQPGIVTGLVGPDGAGKTTLMRLLAGLLVPTAGSILMKGLAAEASPPLEPQKLAPEHFRQSIGYMPQKFGLYEDLTVQENLELHADLRGVAGEERRAEFERLLGFAGLSPFTKRLAGRLSGGMKQKLGLACTLLGRPQLLLLDEPGVGVDPISRRELWKMVGELLRQGLTVVWSTAYLDEAERCGQVMLLNGGVLLFSGAPAEMTSRVADRCWILSGFGASRRQVLGNVLLKPEVLDAAIQGSSIRILLKPGVDAIRAGDLLPNPDARLERDKPRFEDAFIDLLGGGPKGESALSHHLDVPAQREGPVVEAHELTKQFGSFKAADRVSFAVRRGEVFGLLGPNGAGKSTVFRMLCGLLNPSSGTARVMGFDLKSSPAQARQRLGYMAQKFSLYGNLTVEHNLSFFSGAYGLRGSQQRRSIEAMTEVFKLGRFMHTSAEKLPLGYKQRLALACALMHEPDILFLDEPTSGVDPVTRREFWSHINALVKHGVTVIVTTHFMDEAEYCDHIALVFRGQIIASGTPEQLKQSALTPDNSDPSMEEAFIALVENHAGGNGA